MPAPERIIRLKTVLDRTGLSRSTIYRKMAEGTFPPQLKIGVHGAGWHESAIDRWVANPAAVAKDGPVSSIDGPEWWRDAIVYQIYPKSWADGNGDGVGDFNGLRGKLDYLHWLGVDCLWLLPFFSASLLRPLGTAA